MKKSLAIFLSMLALVFTSCFNDVDDTASSPYAILKSFSIGNITSQYPTFTSDGADTITTKTIQGSSYAFSINQATGEVYNADSLPFATKVDKVTFSRGLSGYAKIYVDSLAAFDAFLSTDSIDFTSPRIVRITSTDGEYYKDYTISVNVHQVDPEKIADNLSKSGTYIPGIRPGAETKEYLNKVLNRITVFGAAFLLFIAMLPYLMTMFTNLTQSAALGGTGIIIVVGVATETFSSLKGMLTQKQYRGFVQK